MMYAVAEPSSLVSNVPCEVWIVTLGPSCSRLSSGSRSLSLPLPS